MRGPDLVDTSGCDQLRGLDPDSNERKARHPLPGAGQLGVWEDNTTRPAGAQDRRPGAPFRRGGEAPVVKLGFKSPSGPICGAYSRLGGLGGAPVRADPRLHRQLAPPGPRVGVAVQVVGRGGDLFGGDRLDDRAAHRRFGRRRDGHARVAGAGRGAGVNGAGQRGAAQAGVRPAAGQDQ